jgi:hypothetical protein
MRANSISNRRSAVPAGVTISVDENDICAAIAATAETDRFFDNSDLQLIQTIRGI